MSRCPGDSSDWGSRDVDVGALWGSAPPISHLTEEGTAGNLESTAKHFLGYLHLRVYRFSLVSYNLAHA